MEQLSVREDDKMFVDTAVNVLEQTVHDGVSGTIKIELYPVMLEVMRRVYGFPPDHECYHRNSTIWTGTYTRVMVNLAWIKQYFEANSWTVFQGGSIIIFKR